LLLDVRCAIKENLRSWVWDGPRRNYTKWRRHKGKLGLSAALLLFLIALCAIPSSDPPVSVRFLYETNGIIQGALPGQEALSGKIVAFELVNKLNEPLSGSAVLFRPTDQKILKNSKGSGGVDCAEKGTNILFVTPTPPLGGKYQLFVYGLTVKRTSGGRDIRMRLGKSVERVYSLPLPMQMRLQG